MKKNIIFAAALTIICLNNLFAQEATQVSANVIRTFDKKFSGATNIRWEPQQKGITLAKFRFENETWLAYYSPEGDLITSGRKVKSADQLPLKVKASLEEVQSRYESKYGELAFGIIFEMVGASGTEYFIPLENGKLSMLVSINDGGSSTIQKKVNHPATMAVDQSVIAKKN